MLSFYRQQQSCPPGGGGGAFSLLVAYTGKLSATSGLISQVEVRDRVGKSVI